jgi:orotidine-5'-phosphate decarboxylase
MVTDLVSNHKTVSFSERVRVRARKNRTWLCVGLDPVVDHLPTGIDRSASGVRAFCRRIVEATAPHATCFKINLAFFEALGADGWQTLHDVRREIPPDVPVIADAKRGDIVSTMRAYARSIYGELAFDAVTLNPYMGWETLVPFLQYQGTCSFVLARTSNPGASDLQDLLVGDGPLYLRVAREAVAQFGPGEVGLVAGATDLQSLRAIRSVARDALILVPGIGAQGASAREAVRAGGDDAGENALINVSRGVISASLGADFAEAAAVAAEALARQTAGRMGQ